MKRKQGLLRLLAAATAIAVQLPGAAPSAAGGSFNLRREADSVLELASLSTYADVVRGSAAGDVNGDDIADLLVAQGAPFPDEGGRGYVYVVFGQRPMPEHISLDDEAADHGFVIKGPSEGAHAFETAPAGDVNGDGLGDVVVGAWGADNNGRSNSGSVYVVFGKADHLPVDLALFDVNAQGNLGYRIDGSGVDGILGRSVDGVGDMNGDGLDDIVMAGPHMGFTYVVWGKSDPLPIDLLNMHRPVAGDLPLGFYVRSRPAEYYLFYSAMAVGDVNADGVPDIVIATEECACVVFGKSDTESVRLRRLGDGGFKIKGETMWAAVGAGDVDGDGFDDVLIGAPNVISDHCCGNAHVVFGRDSTRRVHLERLGRRGFTVAGYERDQMFGRAVDAAGDVNGDGRDDIVVGASSTRRTADGERAKGAAFVVYGARRRGTLGADRLGRHGFAMFGGRYGDSSGRSVAGIGDLNGDYKSDLLVGSLGLQAYVVRGR